MDLTACAMPKLMTQQSGPPIYEPFIYDLYAVSVISFEHLKIYDMLESVWWPKWWPLHRSS